MCYGDSLPKYTERRPSIILSQIDDHVEKLWKNTSSMMSATQAQSLDLGLQIAAVIHRPILKTFGA